MKKLTEAQIQKKLLEFDTLPEAIEWLRYLELGKDFDGYGQGTIISFEGVMGGGMTLSAVAAAYQESLNGKKIYSNIKLKFKYTPLKKMDFEKAVNSVVLIDNADMMLDARRSAANLHKLWAYFMAQARKRNMQILLTTQRLEYLDKRIRRMVDTRVVCSHPKKDLFNHISLDLRTLNRISHYFYGTPYYNLYNTLEMVRGV